MASFLKRLKTTPTRCSQFVKVTSLHHRWRWFMSHNKPDSLRLSPSLSPTLLSFRCDTFQIRSGVLLWLLQLFVTVTIHTKSWYIYIIPSKTLNFGDLYFSDRNLKELLIIDEPASHCSPLNKLIFYQTLQNFSVWVSIWLRHAERPGPSLWVSVWEMSSWQSMKAEGGSATGTSETVFPHLPTVSGGGFSLCQFNSGLVETQGRWTGCLFRVRILFLGGLLCSNVGL